MRQSLAVAALVVAAAAGPARADRKLDEAVAKAETQLAGQEVGHSRRHRDRGACIQEERARPPREDVLHRAGHLVARRPHDLGPAVG